MRTETSAGKQTWSFLSVPPRGPLPAASHLADDRYSAALTSHSHKLIQSVEFPSRIPLIIAKATLVTEVTMRTVGDNESIAKSNMSRFWQLFIRWLNFRRNNYVRCSRCPRMNVPRRAGRGAPRALGPALDSLRQSHIFFKICIEHRVS